MEENEIVKKPFSKAMAVIFGFFVMGFVDLIGISINYVKQDFQLTDTLANLLGMSLFLWFAILSIPIALVMNRIGRKKTVLISMVISLVAMILPLIHYSFPMMLAAFTLLGIGNTIIQVSINPLVSDVVTKQKLTSSLTLGQFIKAIAAFLAPIIAVTAASRYGDWKLLFLVYSVVCVVCAVWLMLTPIKEAPVAQASSGMGEVFGLLKDPRILLLFLGIVFVVGIDVGLNSTVPKFLMERFAIPLEKAGLGTSLYFIARTIGTFVGAILLVKFSSKKFFQWSMYVAIPAMIIMLFLNHLIGILIMVFLVGFAVANVFSIIFSAALQARPDKGNEISGLMIVGVVGGAIIPFFMGMLADGFNQTVAMSLLLLLMLYLTYCAFRIPDDIK